MRRLPFGLPLTLVAVALLSLLAFAACGDDEDSNGEPTPVPTTGPDAVATADARLVNCPGEHAACVQGADGEVAFARGDVSIVVRSGLYQTYTCPEPTGEGFDPLSTVCEDEVPGDTVEGLPVGRLQSEGVVVDRAGFGAMLEDWLATIGRPPPFTALGCPVGADGALDCDNRYVLVYTGPVTNEVGELLMVTIDRDETGRLGVSTALTGIFDAGDPGFNKEIVLGGDVGWFPGIPGETPTRYAPIWPPGE